MQIERQRQAEQRLQVLRDMAMGAALDLGKRYVDPKAKDHKPGDPYNDLSPYLNYEQALFDAAYPWTVHVETPEERAAREDAAQDAAFRRMFGVMQA